MSVFRRDNSPAGPAAMTVEELAKVLTEATGQAFTVEMLQADVAAGAPRNEDGTINVTHYAAWLVREVMA